MIVQSNHPYHLVEKRPWPAVRSAGAIIITVGLARWFYIQEPEGIIVGVVVLVISRYQWWRDVIRESYHQGLHTIKVKGNIEIGMVLFIVSEVMFFFSFFWAFYHRRLRPRPELGCVWPAVGIKRFNPYQVPLLNTVVLLRRGVTVTWAHHSIVGKNHSQGVRRLAITIVLGLYFTFLQGFEYQEARFSLADSVYGSVFFIATGFHGVHVIVGSVFLIVGLVRMVGIQYSNTHHSGFEIAIWYWHFVDVVWLFLYSSIYWWGW